MDLCEHDFGLSTPDALALAAILNRRDSFNAPNTPAAGSPELPGQGGCSSYSPNHAWATLQLNETFAYVDDMLSFRAKVVGPANLDRFDYWIGLHVLLRSQAHAYAAWGEFDEAFHKVCFQLMHVFVAHFDFNMIFFVCPQV